MNESLALPPRGCGGPLGVRLAVSGSHTASEVSIRLVEVQIEENALSQNFPNPSLGITTISYKMGGAKGLIVISDIAGAVVREYELANGKGQIVVNEKLNAGAYIYSLIEDGVLTQQRKMLVME